MKNVLNVRAVIKKYKVHMLMLMDTNTMLNVFQRNRLEIVNNAKKIYSRVNNMLKILKQKFYIMANVQKLYKKEFKILFPYVNNVKQNLMGLTLCTKMNITMKIA